MSNFAIPAQNEAYLGVGTSEITQKNDNFEKTCTLDELRSYARLLGSRWKELMSEHGVARLYENRVPKAPGSSVAAVAAAILAGFLFLACNGQKKPEEPVRPHPAPLPRPAPQPAPAPAPEPRAAVMAIDMLNAVRAKAGVPPVTEQASLDQRCYDWAQQMAGRAGFNHDRSVYGTDERENIAWYSSGIDPKAAMDMWVHSGPHYTAMVDQRGFPRAVVAGYAQYKGFACLRLCPKPHDPRVCN